MKKRSVLPMRAAKIGYVVISIMLCAVGLLFITKPTLSARTLACVLGAALIIFGGVKLIGYFSKDLYRLAFQYDWAMGVILLLLGVILLARPADVLSSVFLALGIATLMDSLFKARTALDARAFGIQAWWLILTLAILTACAGVMLVIRPWASAQALTILLGISLLVQGVLNLCTALSAVKVVKTQYPDVIDVEYEEQTGDLP